MVELGTSITVALLSSATVTTHPELTVASPAEGKLDDADNVAGGMLNSGVAACGLRALVVARHSVVIFFNSTGNDDDTIDFVVVAEETDEVTVDKVASILALLFGGRFPV